MSLEGLAQAIAAEPHADDLRLIYADFLEEHGHWQKAAFIRAQIEAAMAGTDCPRKVREVHELPQRGPYVRTLEYPVRCGTCDFCRPTLRAESLYREYPLAVFDPPCPCGVCVGHHEPAANPHPNLPTFYLWRGFVQAIYCPLKFWEENGPSLLSLPIEYVRPTDKEPARTTSRFTWWGYRTVLRRPDPDGIPDHLVGGKRCIIPSAEGFPSVRAAFDWLSERLLAWARPKEDLHFPQF